MSPLMRKTFGLLGALAMAAALPSCMGTVGTGYYDTQRCYWTWVNDTYGGYEQLYCWNGGYNTYYPYVQRGVNVRRYPGWYTGGRTVVAPPAVGIVRPPGVNIVPPPAMPVRPPTTVYVP